MTVKAIDNKRKNPFFQATWVMGIRCNFDCSYCPSWRHNLTQPFQSVEKLKRTVDFMKEYLDLQIQHTDADYMGAYDLNLTGGEPTAHPHMMEIMDYVKEQIPYLNLSLTTNGFYNPVMGEQLARDYLEDITFSYHAEANIKQKRQVIENILQAHEYVNDDDYMLDQISVNVMMHEDPDLFADCQRVIDSLSAKGITVRPRTIDRDDKVQSAGRTATKIKNSRFGPSSGKTYTDGQLRDLKKTYVKQYGIDEKTELKNEQWNKDTKTKQVNGRPCCGGVTMSTQDSDTGEWTETKLIFDRNFKDWYCLVNLEWLYIEQDDDEIFTHQTCKANFDNQKGPVGTITEYEKYIDFLKSHYEKGQLPLIRCPNTKCTCGICTPKSNDIEQATKFFNRQLPNIIPITNL